MTSACLGRYRRSRFDFDESGQWIPNTQSSTRRFTGLSDTGNNPVKGKVDITLNYDHYIDDARHIRLTLIGI
ncbi:MAG: hypothetical protein U0487_00675 [Patescibacteria group bacterium]